MFKMQGSRQERLSAYFSVLHVLKIKANVHVHVNVVNFSCYIFCILFIFCSPEQDCIVTESVICCYKLFCLFVCFRHLNGAVLETLSRPSLLITDSFNALNIQARRRERDTQLMSMFYIQLHIHKHKI